MQAIGKGFPKDIYPSLFQGIEEYENRKHTKRLSKENAERYRKYGHLAHRDVFLYKSETDDHAIAV